MLAEKLVREVAQTVSGCLFSCKRAAVGERFSGKDTGVLVHYLLVLTKHIADLARSGSDVACRNVGVGSDVAVKLRHECLTEAHDLRVALSLRVKVGAALGTAHRQTGQGVLEHLLEAEELQDRGVDRRVKPDAALVRSDSRIELETVAAVDSYIARVVYPCYSESYRTLRLGHSFDYPGLHDVGALFDDRRKRLKHLSYRLMEFGLSGVAFNNAFIYSGKVSVFYRHIYFLRMFCRIDFFIYQL